VTPKSVLKHKGLFDQEFWQQSDSVEILNATDLSNYRELSLSSTKGIEVHR